MVSSMWTKMMMEPELIQEVKKILSIGIKMSLQAMGRNAESRIVNDQEKKYKTEIKKMARPHVESGIAVLFIV